MTTDPTTTDHDTQPTGRDHDHARETVPFELMESVCAVLNRFADEREGERDEGSDVYEADYATEIVALVRAAEREIAPPADGWREGDAVVVTYDDGGPNPIGTWIRRRGYWASGNGINLPWTPEGEAVDSFFTEGRVVLVHAPRIARSAS